MAGNARTVGERVEQLLDRMPAGPHRDTAEELVHLLVQLYGDGLARIAAVLDAGQLTRLAEDDLVESLLLLHELHPLDVDTRVRRALDRIEPFLGSHAGGVAYLGVSDGVARLRLQGGCASSSLTTKMAIEGAVREAAPELTGIEVTGLVEPLPHSDMSQPQRTDGGWAPLPDLGPSTTHPLVVDVAEVAVLVCTVRGTLYAYRDACAGCGSSLAGASLADAELACPSCGARFDVRLAGRGVDDATRHLEPLPLRADSGGVRVAVRS